MKRTRMSQSARRWAILESAVPLFAAKGFHGVKTRELAAAAGVSEALLFRHFNDKEELHRAVLEHVHGAEEDSEAATRWLALPPSTDKLMLGLHMILAHLAEDAPPESKVMPRLVAQSLLGDGSLAREHLRRFERLWWPAFAASLQAARDAGDARSVETPDMLLVWFFHHLGFAVRLLKLPGATVDYGLPTEEMVGHQVRMLLRGVGFKEDVIQTRYQPKNLKALLG